MTSRYRQEAGGCHSPVLYYSTGEVEHIVYTI